MSAEGLAAAAWDNRLPPDVRASVQVIISNLRKLFRLSGLDPQTVLATAPHGYRLHCADGDCDVDRFLAHKKLGLRAAAARRFSDASAHFTEALSLWKGPVLDDLQHLRFAEFFATALDEERLVAVTCRAEAEIACGRATTVIADLVTLTDQHPFLEPLWAQLIRALYVSGRQSDALDACRRLRAALADELGIDPSPSLRDLEAHILRQEPLQVHATAEANATTIIERHFRTTRAQLRDSSGRAYPITAAGIRIGRLPDNNVVLDDGMVSRHHARIEDAGQRVVIRDLQSSNGVVVNGNRIIETATLTAGDIIRIGGTELSFEVIDEVES